MKRKPSAPSRPPVLIDRPPRVLLDFPTANLIHRQILNGILRYAHQHGPWEFHMITHMLGEQGLRRTREWGCSGAIALVDTLARARAVLSTGAPTVFFNPPRALLTRLRAAGRWSCVLRDQTGLGRAGAAYFAERQYSHFAFVGEVNDAAWSLERARGFCERVAECGCVCERYPSLPRRERDDFGLEQKRLRAWLRALPKPVALMAAWDRRARQVLDTCLEAGISVPHEIAVLGVDNDEILCETTTPSLSSVALDGENNGFEIAKLLDRQMRGARARRPEVHVLGLASIVSRRSTETTCVADPLIAKALAFIQANPGVAVTVGEVARHLNVSRRLLELKARQSFGRTIRDEIQRIRFDRVRSLLQNTELTVSEIAASCGFYDPSHLCLRFRRTFGLTPAAFRADVRGALDAR
jgi:LacI family transcriptional regulator